MRWAGTVYVLTAGPITSDSGCALTLVKYSDLVYGLNSILDIWGAFTHVSCDGINEENLNRHTLTKLGRL